MWTVKIFLDLKPLKLKLSSARLAKPVEIIKVQLGFIVEESWEFELGNETKTSLRLDSKLFLFSRIF